MPIIAKHYGNIILLLIAELYVGIQITFIPCVQHVVVVVFLFPANDTAMKIYNILQKELLGPLLLTWFNFNPSMDK